MSKIETLIDGKHVREFCLKELKLMMTDFDWTKKIAKHIDTINMLCCIDTALDAILTAFISYAKDGILPTPDELIQLSQEQFNEANHADRELVVDYVVKALAVDVSKEEAVAIKNFVTYENLFVRLLKLNTRINGMLFHNIDVTDPNSAYQLIEFCEDLKVIPVQLSKCAEVTRNILEVTKEKNQGNEKPSDYE